MSFVTSLIAACASAGSPLILSRMLRRPAAITLPLMALHLDYVTTAGARCALRGRPRCVNPWGANDRQREVWKVDDRAHCRHSLTGTSAHY